MMLDPLFRKGYMADIPTATVAGEISFQISARGLGLKEKIELEVTIAEESRAYYALQPEVVKATLDPATVLPLRLKILALEDVKPAVRGRWFNPLIFVKFDFRTSYHSGSVVRRVAFTEKKWW